MSGVKIIRRLGYLIVTVFTFSFLNNVSAQEINIDELLKEEEIFFEEDGLDVIIVEEAPEELLNLYSENETYFHPSYDDEYIPDASYSEIADRMSCIQSEMPLHFNETVNSFINYFTVRNRNYTKDVFRISPSYFHIFESYLKKHNLPDELKYLPVIESGLRAKARSRAAAVGLWQFIPSTGRIYDLHQDWYIDERMDPHLASEAACRHLKSLHRMFGDWELALAAYNCGAGNVRKAMRRSGYKETFWDIYNYLPRETRSYVPQFVAVVYTFKYAEEHNFVFERTEYKNEIDYETIYVNGFTNLKSLAEQLNICYEDIDDLNPSIKHGAVPDGMKDYPIRIPSDIYDTFIAQKDVILDSASKAGKANIDYVARNTPGNVSGREKITYRVQYGDVLGTIAEKHRVKVSDLRSWNNINGNLIKVGQKLDIWVAPSTYAQARPSTPSAKNTPQVNVSAGGSKYHVVQPGDTLWDISKAYDGLSIERLKQLNNLKNNNIKPGQKLVIG